MSSSSFFVTIIILTNLYLGPQAVRMTCSHFFLLWGIFLNTPFHLCRGYPRALQGRIFILDHPREACWPRVSWYLTTVRGPQQKYPDHAGPRYHLPLSGLNLLNPLTSWELEEKPSSLRLVLSLVVGLSAEATGPISLWAPLCVSFCFLASFLWDMCKGKNHSQMVPVEIKRWEDRLLLVPASHPLPSHVAYFPQMKLSQALHCQGGIELSPPVTTGLEAWDACCLIQTVGITSLRLVWCFLYSPLEEEEARLVFLFSCLWMGVEIESGLSQRLNNLPTDGGWW